MTVTLSGQDLFQMTQDIVTAMLGLEIKQENEEPAGEMGAMVTSSVHFTGDWQGALLIDTPTALATKLTQVMLGMENETPAEDEVADAMGEFANMLGGNFKALVGGQCRLSLPSVTRGEHFETVILNGKTQTVFYFKCEGCVLRVKIIEQEMSVSGSATTADA